MKNAWLKPAIPAALIALAACVMPGCSNPAGIDVPKHDVPDTTPLAATPPVTTSPGTAAPDTTPPGVITNLAAHTDTGSVTFTWTDPSDSDFARVEIWFGANATATSGTSVPPAAKGTKTYTGNGTPGDVRYYHFIAVDTSGNRSAVVNYKITFLPAPPVPVEIPNLAGIIGDGSVSFTWTDPVDPAFHHVEISWTSPPPGSSGSETISRGKGTYTLTGLIENETYTFTVKACYTGGSKSTGISVTMTLAPDTTAPGPVTGLGAGSGDFGSVTLSWTNPGDTDLQYVEITCEPFIGPAQTVNASAGAGGTYTWNGLAGGVEYTFTVKAVDHNGNRSAGVSATGTPYDTTPPAPVTNFVGNPGDGCVVLSWTNPGDTDLQHVEITCEPSTGPAQTINALAGTDGTYTWNDLTNDTAYTFTVKTVDANGNRSAGVSATGTPYDMTPPAPVTNLAGNPGEGCVVLSWTNPGDTDLQHVEITCEPSTGPAQTVNASAGADGTYTWNGLAGGVEYTFTVKAVDHRGNRSAGVGTTCTPYDTTPPAPVTNLVGNPGDKCVVLSWTNPGDTDLQHVEITCEPSTGPAQTVNASAGTGGTYTWNGLTNDTAYTFTVKTVDHIGNQSAGVTIGPVTPLPAPRAEGGMVTIVKVEGSSPLKWWEIHTFTESVTLTFLPGYTSITADYLIVAGGGGSGGDNSSYVNFDHSGGGGAGGLLYKTGEVLSLSGGVVQITVGAGGAGGTSASQGTDGGKSAIGTIEVPGGGSGGRTSSNMDGRPGGSGGGGGSGNGGTHGTGGLPNSSDPAVQGYNGGSGGGGGSGDDGGGGGGGAGGPGSNGGNSSGGSGGAPWNATDAGASWLVDATKTTEFPAGTNLFSHGGKGGSQNSPDGGTDGAYYGDGGTSGKYNAANLPGGSGHSGIVVIRFQRD